MFQYPAPSNPAPTGPTGPPISATQLLLFEPSPAPAAQPPSNSHPPPPHHALRRHIHQKHPRRIHGTLIRSNRAFTRAQFIAGYISNNLFHSLNLVLHFVPRDTGRYATAIIGISGQTAAGRYDTLVSWDVMATKDLQELVRIVEAGSMDAGLWDRNVAWRESMNGVMMAQSGRTHMGAAAVAQGMGISVNLNLQGSAGTDTMRGGYPVATATATAPAPPMLQGSVTGRSSRTATQTAAVLCGQGQGEDGYLGALSASGIGISTRMSVQPATVTIPLIGTPAHAGPPISFAHSQAFQQVGLRSGGGLGAISTGRPLLKGTNSADKPKDEDTGNAYKGKFAPRSGRGRGRGRGAKKFLNSGVLG